MASSVTIAMMPNTENDALAMRRYSSMPAPMTRAERAWNTEMDVSHSSANKQENIVITGPG